MKRMKFLALVLVVAVMLIGAAYAYWNEEILITSNVNTGFLDVDIVGTDWWTFSSETPDVTIPFTENLDNEYATIDFSGHTSNDGANNDNDFITINFRNLYPNSSAVARIVFKNNGTLPVKIADFIPVEFTDAADIFTLHERLFAEVYINNGNYPSNAVQLELDPDRLGFKIPDGKAFIVDTGEEIALRITMIMPGDVKYNNNTELCNLSAVIKPNFVQFNEE